MKYKLLLISSVLVTICNACSKSNLEPVYGNDEWLTHCAKISLPSESDDDEVNLEIGLQNWLGDPTNENGHSADALLKDLSKIGPQTVPWGSPPKSEGILSVGDEHQEEIPSDDKQNTTTDSDSINSSEGRPFVYHKGLNNELSPIQKRSSKKREPFSKSNIFSHLTQKRYDYIPYKIDRESDYFQKAPINVNVDPTSLTCIFIGQLPIYVPDLVFYNVFRRLFGPDTIRYMRTVLASDKECAHTIGMCIKTDQLNNCLFFNKRVFFDLYGIWIDRQNTSYRITNIEAREQATAYHLSLPSITVEIVKSRRLSVPLLQAAGSTTVKTKQKQKEEILNRAKDSEQPPEEKKTNTNLTYYQNSKGEVSQIFTTSSHFPPENIFSFEKEEFVPQYIPYEITQESTGNDAYTYYNGNPLPYSSLVRLPNKFPITGFQKVLEKLMGSSRTTINRLYNDYISISCVSEADFKKLMDFSQCIVLDVYGAHIFPESQKMVSKLAVPGEYGLPRCSLKILPNSKATNSTWHEFIPSETPSTSEGQMHSQKSTSEASASTWIPNVKASAFTPAETPSTSEDQPQQNEKMHSQKSNSKATNSTWKANVNAPAFIPSETPSTSEGQSQKNERMHNQKSNSKATNSTWIPNVKASAFIPGASKSTNSTWKDNVSEASEATNSTSEGQS